MNRRLKVFVEERLQKLGYVLLPNWRVGTYALARHLGTLFNRLEIDCVVDVGANTGGYATFLRRDVKYDGLIVSVEPTEGPWRTLCGRAAKDPNWLVRRSALGAAPGRMPINIAGSSEFSSFLCPNDAAVPQLAQANATISTEMVEVETFADLLSDLRLKHSLRNVYLKMDTQGYDLEVLKGCGDAIQHVAALQSEMSVLPIYVDMPSYQDVLSYTNNMGFLISYLSPVTVDAKLRMVEFDCVMVRETLSSSLG